jgi:hypothetical protein
MMDSRFWDIERVAGFVLVLGVVTVFPGLIMFWMRAGHQGGQPPTSAYFLWERGFILAAVIITALGFLLLEGALQTTDGRSLARLGATAYFFGGILVVIGEVLMPTVGYQKLYGLIVIYVVMAFLGQAALGGAVLQTGWLPGWVGWVTILWNIAWLVVLPLLSPRDIYFPIIHHLAPLLLGIALLWRAP